MPELVQKLAIDFQRPQTYLLNHRWRILDWRYPMQMQDVTTWKTWSTSTEDKMACQHWNAMTNLDIWQQSILMTWRTLTTTVEIFMHGGQRNGLKELELADQEMSIPARWWHCTKDFVLQTRHFGYAEISAESKYKVVLFNLCRNAPLFGLAYSSHPCDQA